MYTLYKFHFLNGISEINQLFDDILIMTSTCMYDSATFSSKIEACLNQGQYVLIFILILWE